MAQQGTLLYQSPLALAVSGWGSQASNFHRPATWQSEPIAIPDWATRWEAAVQQSNQWSGSHRYSVAVFAMLEMNGLIGRHDFGGGTFPAGKKNYVPKTGGYLPFICSRCERMYFTALETADSHLRRFAHYPDPWLPAGRKLILTASAVDGLVLTTISLEVR